MGMYDTFVGNCPSCGKEFDSQTKLTECIMHDFNVGSSIELSDMRLQLKSPCFECHTPIVAVIRGGHIVEYTTGNPTQVEGRWGALHNPETAVEDEEKNVQDFCDSVTELAAELRKEREKE